MRPNPLRLRPSAVLSIAVLLPCALALPGCATFGSDAGAGGIPEDAVPTVRREANGDTVTQYRVGGRVRAVKVEPSRGPVYYLYDRDGDGVIDKAGDNPPQTYFKLFGWN
ncbi:MAG: DUF2782 domain-containing protein [Luteimonas sp.]